MARTVRSELSGRMVSIDSDEWRHECEVAFLLGLPQHVRDKMLDGVPGSSDPDEQGIVAVLGEAVVDVLRADIEKLARLREVARRGRR